MLPLNPTVSNNSQQLETWSTSLQAVQCIGERPLQEAQWLWAFSEQLGSSLLFPVYLACPRVLMNMSDSLSWFQELPEVSK